MNILQGLEMHEEIINEAEETKLLNDIEKLFDAGEKRQLPGGTFNKPAKNRPGNGRRTVQFGCACEFLNCLCSLRAALTSSFVIVPHGRRIPRYSGPGEARDQAEDGRGIHAPLPAEAREASRGAWSLAQRENARLGHH